MRRTIRAALWRNPAAGRALLLFINRAERRTEEGQLCFPPDSERKRRLILLETCVTPDHCASEREGCVRERHCLWMWVCIRVWQLLTLCLWKGGLCVCLGGYVCVWHPSIVLWELKLEKGFHCLPLSASVSPPSALWVLVLGSSPSPLLTCILLCFPNWLHTEHWGSACARCD